MIETIDRKSFTTESIFSELEEKHTEMIDTYYSFQNGLTLLKQLSFPSSRYPIAPDCEIPNSVIRGFWKEEKYEKEEEVYEPAFTLGFISSKELLLTKPLSDEGEAETEDGDTVSSKETKKPFFQKRSKRTKHTSKHKRMSMLSKSMPEDAKNSEFVQLCHQLFNEIWFPPDCEMDFTSIIDQLIVLLDTKDPDIHTKVCHYILDFHRIKKIPPEKISLIGQKAINQLTNGNDPVISINSIQLLAGLNIKTDISVSMIKSFLTSHNSDLRKTSREALRMLGVKQDNKYASQKESSSPKEKSSQLNEKNSTKVELIREVLSKIPRPVPKWKSQKGNSKPTTTNTSTPAKSANELLTAIPPKSEIGGIKKKTSKGTKSQLKTRGSKGSVKRRSSKKLASEDKDQAGKGSEIKSKDQDEKESEFESKDQAEKELEFISQDQVEQESEFETQDQAEKELEFVSKDQGEQESEFESKDQAEKESDLETKAQTEKESDLETRAQTEKEPDSEITDQAGKESDSVTADHDRKESDSKAKDRTDKESDSKAKDRTDKEDGVKDQIAKESVSEAEDQAGKGSDAEAKKMAKEIIPSSVEDSQDLQEDIQPKDLEVDKGEITKEDFLGKTPGSPTTERDRKQLLLDTDTSFPDLKGQPTDNEETLTDDTLHKGVAEKDIFVSDFKFSSKQPLPFADDIPDDSPTKETKIRQPAKAKKQKIKVQPEPKRDTDEMYLKKKQHKFRLPDAPSEVQSAKMQALRKQKQKYELDQHNRDKISKLNDLKRNTHFLNKDAVKSSVGKKLVKRPTDYFLDKDRGITQKPINTIDKIRSSLLNYSKLNKKMGSFIRELNAIDRIPKKSTMSVGYKKSMLDPGKGISDEEFQAQIQAKRELMEAANLSVQTTAPTTIIPVAAAFCAFRSAVSNPPGATSLPQAITGPSLGFPVTAIPPEADSTAIPPSAAAAIAAIPPAAAAATAATLPGAASGSDQLTSQEKEYYGIQSEVPSEMQPSSGISNSIFGNQMTAVENLERFSRDRRLSKKRSYRKKDDAKIDSIKQQLQQSPWATIDDFKATEQEHVDPGIKELKMLSKEREIGLSKKWSSKPQLLNTYKSFRFQNNQGVSGMVAEQRLGELDDWDKKRTQRGKPITGKTEESDIKKWVNDLPWSNIQKAFSNTLDQRLGEIQGAQREQRWTEGAELFQEGDHLKRGKSSRDRHLKKSSTLNVPWQSFLANDIDTGDSLITYKKDTDREQKWSEISDSAKKRIQRAKSITVKTDESDIKKWIRNIPWPNIQRGNALDQRLGEIQEAQREQRWSEGAELFQEGDHLKRGKSSRDRHLQKRSTSHLIDIDTGDSLLTDMKDTDREQRWSEFADSRASQKYYGQIPSIDKAFYQVDKLSPWMRYHLQYKPERIEEEEYVPSFELKNVSQTPPEWFPKYRRMMFSPDFYQQREKWLNDYRRPTSIIY